MLLPQSSKSFNSTTKVLSEKPEPNPNANESASDKSSSEEADDGSGDWRQEGVKKKKKVKGGRKSGISGDLPT